MKDTAEEAVLLIVMVTFFPLPDPESQQKIWLAAGMYRRHAAAILMQL